MSSTPTFEEDVQVAFRSILHLSANYRALKERCDRQEQTIRELTEQLKSAEITSVTKVNIPTVRDISNNTVGLEKSVINGQLECKSVKPPVIGQLECKSVKPMVIGQLECKSVKPPVIDPSNNTVGLEKFVVNGPLKCKPVKPMVIDCSNILQDKPRKSYSGTKVGEPGETMSRNIFRDRA